MSKVIYKFIKDKRNPEPKICQFLCPGFLFLFYVCLFQYRCAAFLAKE